MIYNLKFIKEAAFMYFCKYEEIFQVQNRIYRTS